MLIIRSAEKTYKRRICLSVCRSVCLLAALRETTDRIFMKILPQDKEELITFWKSSASRYGSRNFKKNSSTLRHRVFFHNLTHISGKTDRICLKILSQMYLRTSLSPLTFGFALAEVCTLHVLLSSCSRRLVACKSRRRLVVLKLNRARLALGSVSLQISAAGLLHSSSGSVARQDDTSAD